MPLAEGRAWGREWEPQQHVPTAWSVNACPFSFSSHVLTFPPLWRPCALYECLVGDQSAETEVLHFQSATQPLMFNVTCELLLD